MKCKRRRRRANGTVQYWDPIYFLESDQLTLSWPHHLVFLLSPAQKPHPIRLRVPTGRSIAFADAVYGAVQVDTREVDDQVLIKVPGRRSRGTEG